MIPLRSQIHQAPICQTSLWSSNATTLVATRNSLSDRPAIAHTTGSWKRSSHPSLTISHTETTCQITKHFGLAVPFTIQWQDDEKDWHLIEDEVSLMDAIDFFQSGEEGSVASSGSVFASRSSSRRITVLVEICVDYDGPSLSETSSVREGHSPEGSLASFLPGELSGSPQDDDAVTVSSKDTRGPRAKAKADSSLFKKILNGTSRSASSSSSSKTSLKPSRSRIFNLGSRASSSAEVEATTGGLTDSALDDHLAVFERLKLEEQRRPPSVQERPALQTDRGKAWLQNQNTIQKTILGVVPSMGDDMSSVDDSPFSDGNSDMGISLQRDERGKLYYNLTSFGSSESAGDLEYEFVNGTQPSKPHVPRVAPFPNSHLQTTPRTIFTSFWCPKWLQTAQNAGLSSTSSSTFARLAARRRPCHVPRLPLPPLQLQPGWEKASVVPLPPPITIIAGIVPSMKHKVYPTHPARIATQPHSIPPTPTCPYTRQTPSLCLRYLPIRPHKQYSATALAPNRHWFLQAHQDLHPRQRALDMSFVIPASKRSAAITHCLSVWTARNRHQPPKNLQLPVEAPLRKETCDMRSCSRYGVRASMVGRTSVISLSFCNPRSGELNKHGINRADQYVGSLFWM